MNAPRSSAFAVLATLALVAPSHAQNLDFETFPQSLLPHWVTLGGSQGGPPNLAGFGFNSARITDGAGVFLGTFTHRGAAIGQDIVCPQIGGNTTCFIRFTYAFDDLALGMPTQAFLAVDGPAGLFVAALPDNNSVATAVQFAYPACGPLSVYFGIIEQGAPGIFLSDLHVDGIGLSCGLSTAAPFISGGPAPTSGVLAELLQLLDVELHEFFTESCNGDGGNQMGCTDCPCGNNAPAGTVGGCVNSFGTSARLIPSGNAYCFNDTVHLDLVDALPASFAVLTSGQSVAPANPANPCVGLDSGIQSVTMDGLRCVVLGVLRHGARATNAVGATNNGWGPPNGPIGGLALSAAVTCGQTRHFQAIYRELPTAGCQRGQNSTQAVSVRWR